jgi:hypothetical protein
MSPVAECDVFMCGKLIIFSTIYLYEKLEAHGSNLLCLKWTKPCSTERTFLLGISGFMLLACT